MEIKSLMENLIDIQKIEVPKDYNSLLEAYKELIEKYNQNVSKLNAAEQTLIEESKRNNYQSPYK